DVPVGESLEHVVEQWRRGRYRPEIEYQDLAVVDPLLREGLRDGERPTRQSGELPRPPGGASSWLSHVVPWAAPRRRADTVAHQLHHLGDDGHQLEVRREREVDTRRAAHHRHPTLVQRLDAGGDAPGLSLLRHPCDLPLLLR